jgi:hypothetical protein
MTQRPIIISGGTEHEANMMATSVLVGVGMLLVAPAPQSVLAVLPGWLVTVWAGTWVASGVAGLVALYWRRNLTRSLLIERAALVLNAAAVGTFAVSAFVFAGWRAWVAGCFLAGWAVANLLRAWRIGGEVMQLTEMGRK